MKKILIIITGLVCFCLIGNAQQFNYGWHHKNAKNKSTSAEFICVKNDTVYVLSQFDGDTIDANPGTGSTLITGDSVGVMSNVVYVNRYLTNGQYAGSFKLMEVVGGYFQLQDLEIGEHGEIMVVGSTYATMHCDFDPGPSVQGSYSFPTTNGTISFVAFYTAAGGLQGVIEYPYISGTQYVYIDDIALDNNALYLAGTCVGSAVDLDFTAAADIVVPSSYDAFVVKLNVATGAYEWGYHVGGPMEDEAAYIEAQNGKIFFTGFTEGPVIDLDPGAGVQAFTTSAMAYAQFVSVWSDTGGFVNGAVLYGNHSIDVAGMTVDENNAIYLSSFVYDGDTIDVNPGAGSLYVYPTGYDQFLNVKLNADMSYAWHNIIEGLGNDVWVEADFDKSNLSNGGEYIGMTFSHSNDVVTFTTQFGMDTIDSFAVEGSCLMAVNKLTGGIYPFTDIITSTSILNSFVTVADLQVYNNNLYVAGSFRGAVDFNPFDMMALCDTSYEELSNYWSSPYTLRINWTDLSSAPVIQELKGSVYPNPFTDQVWIKTDEVITYLHLYSVSGAMVKTFSLKGEDLLMVNLEGLAPGIYVLEAGNKNGNFKTRLIRQ